MSPTLPVIVASRLEDISEHWGQTTLPLSIILISVGLVAILLGVLSAMRVYRSRRQRSMPLVTFHRLARGCGLSLTDQWLLWRVARHQALPTPLTLMLSTRTLHHHVRQYLTECSRPKQKRVLHRTGAIRTQLRKRHHSG